MPGPSCKAGEAGTFIGARPDATEQEPARQPELTSPKRRRVEQQQASATGSDNSDAELPADHSSAGKVQQQDTGRQRYQPLCGYGLAAEEAQMSGASDVEEYEPLPTCPICKLFIALLVHATGR